MGVRNQKIKDVEPFAEGHFSGKCADLELSSDLSDSHLCQIYSLIDNIQKICGSQKPIVNILNSNETKSAQTTSL